jgi:gliding motility-associated-like protein
MKIESCRLNSEYLKFKLYGLRYFDGFLRKFFLIFSLLVFVGLSLYAQSDQAKENAGPKVNKGNTNLLGSEAARFPSGLDFPADLEKVYGDPEYELGEKFDLNGFLIYYSAEDTSILKIDGNRAMILKAGETKVFAEISVFRDQSNSLPSVQHLEIKPKVLKLSVLPGQKKIYGESDPVFVFGSEGLVYGQGQEIFSGKLQREPGENVGKYSIAQGDLKISPNYEIEFVASDFEIVPREVFVEAQQKLKYFGADDPELTYLVKGIDSENSDAVVSGKLKRQQGEKVGKYAIQAGDLTLGANFRMSFSESVFEIAETELSAIFEPGAIETAWSVLPKLPTQVGAFTKDGQIIQLPVNWDKNPLDLLKKGPQTLLGACLMPDGIRNPTMLAPTQKITVLPKASPEDVLLNRTKFEPVSSKSFFEIAQFKVVDQLDNIHTVTLVEGNLDNSFFQINGLSLSWNNSGNNKLKTQYSILVKVLDRAGNSIEKQFDLTSEFRQISNLVVHNVFTPNNDGFNDTWGIPALNESKGIQVQVFNVNGDMLFEASGSEKEWDGTFQGKSVPTGIYYWVIKAQSSGETRRGFLTLLRQ